MLFDDLSSERIRYVNIEDALRQESPYLLFYRVQPIEGDPGNIEEGERPPSYVGNDSGVAGLSLSSMESNGSTGVILDRPQVSFEDFEIEDLKGRTSDSSERRPSITFTEDVASPPLKENYTAESSVEQSVSGNNSLTVSRKSSKSGRRGSKSGPNSQGIDSRLSASFTRLAGRLTKEKPEVISPTAEVRDHDQLTALRAAVQSGPDGVDTAKWKKEVKEKSKTRHPAQHLMKGKPKSGKPDRECLVM